MNEWIKIEDKKPLLLQPIIFVVDSCSPDYKGQLHIGDYIGENRCLSNKKIYPISHWRCTDFLPKTPDI